MLRLREESKVVLSESNLRRRRRKGRRASAMLKSGLATESAAAPRRRDVEWREQAATARPESATKEELGGTERLPTRSLWSRRLGQKIGHSVTADVESLVGQNQLMAGYGLARWVCCEKRGSCKGRG